MSSIKLITFDLDDTLWDTKPALINAEIATRDWLEQRVGAIEWGDMNSFLNLRSDLVSKDPSLDWDIGKLRKEIYRSKLESHIPDAIELDSIIEDSFNFHFEKRHDLTFYDGALEALEYLSTKYHLGVLTNGNADINKLEIDKYFKFSISSKDVKSNKPSSGHFDEALRLADRIAIMKDGEIKAFGKPEEIMTDDFLTSIYEVPIKVKYDPLRIHYY